MARPKLNETEKKEKKLTVRFRACEMEELLQQSDLSGLSLSELVRRRSLGRQVVARSDLKVIGELRRLGGLFKHIYNETDGRCAHETGPLLEEVRAAITRVGREGDVA